jgi:type II secretory pathway pseudopilin PulG
MGTTNERGFTVIEVMLFLAVTGLLAVGILVGSGVSIGQQRYRDSVNSLKSFIQEQYSQTTNVANDRAATWTCDTTADVETAPVGSGQPRGTSDCVLMGRFVTIDASGTKLTASNLVGHRNAGAATGASDVLELENYRLGISPINQVNEDVAWGATVVQPKTTTPMPLSLLIVRSPLSGSVLTFASDGVKTNLNELIDVNNLKVTKNLCVNADAGSFVGRRAAVQIGVYASSPGAIQIPSESSNICD